MLLQAVHRQVILSYYADELRALQHRAHTNLVAIQELKGLCWLVEAQISQPDIRAEDLALCAHVLLLSEAELQKQEAEAATISNQVRTLIAAQALQEVFQPGLSNPSN